MVARESEKKKTTKAWDTIMEDTFISWAERKTNVFSLAEVSETSEGHILLRQRKRKAVTDATIILVDEIPVPTLVITRTTPTTSTFSGPYSMGENIFMDAAFPSTEKLLKCLTALVELVYINSLGLSHKLFEGSTQAYSNIDLLVQSFILSFVSSSHLAETAAA